MEISYKNISASPNKALDSKECEALFWAEGWLTREGKYFDKLDLDLSKVELVKQLVCGDFVLGANLYDGPKTNESWKGCEALQIDVDGTLSAEEALKRLEALGCDYVLRYSRSHGTGRKGDGDRFHILIALDERVSKVEDRDVLSDWIESVFGVVDKAGDRLSQCLYPGSKQFEPVVVSGRGGLSVERALYEGRLWRMKKNHAGLKQKVAEHKEAMENKETAAVAKRDGVHLIDLDLEVEFKGYGLHTVKWMLENWDRGPRNYAGKINYEVVCPVCGHDGNIRGGTAGSVNAHFWIPDNSETGTVALDCSSCRSRGMGAGGQGIYNINKKNIFKWSQNAKEWSIFLDKLNGNEMVHMYRSKATGSLMFVGTNLFAAKNECKKQGVNMPEVLPSYELRLKFDSDERFLDDIEVVNRYDAPKVLRTEADSSVTVDDFKNINKLIRFALGEGCAGRVEFEESVEHFYNWLGWIVQNRAKIRTAYLMHGVEGTGKGLVYNYVLKPIFGMEYCKETGQERLVSQFNKYVGESIFLLVDEIEMDMSKNKGLLETRIKTFITEDFIMLEGKGKDACVVPITCNMLFFSNKAGAVKITESDRRFNVAFRQEEELKDQQWLIEGWGTPHKFKDSLHGELKAFVAWLKARNVPGSVVAGNLRNAAWKSLVEDGKTDIEGLIACVRYRDVEWLEVNVDRGVLRPDGVDMRKVVDVAKEHIKQGFILPNELMELYKYFRWLEDPRFELDKCRRMPKELIRIAKSQGVFSDENFIWQGKRVRAYITHKKASKHLINT